MAIDQTRNQKTLLGISGRSRFAPSREIELNLSRTGAAFEDLHPNTRDLCRRDRSAHRKGMFNFHSNHLD